MKTESLTLFPLTLLEAVLKDTASHIALDGNRQDRPKGLAPYVASAASLSQSSQINECVTSVN